MWSLNTMEYQLMPFVETQRLSYEVSQNQMWQNLYAEPKKIDTNEFMPKQTTNTENKITKRKGCKEEVNQEFGTDRYTLVNVKQITAAYCIAQETIFNVL